MRQSSQNPSTLLMWAKTKVSHFSQNCSVVVVVQCSALLCSSNKLDFLQNVHYRVESHVKAVFVRSEWVRKRTKHNLLKLSPTCRVQISLSPFHAACSFSFVKVSAKKWGKCQQQTLTRVETEKWHTSCFMQWMWTRSLKWIQLPAPFLLWHNWTMSKSDSTFCTSEPQIKEFHLFQVS